MTRLGMSMFANKEDYLKARIEELEATLARVRDEISGCIQRDSAEFMTMTIEQVESWGVARHNQSHGYCLGEIREVLGDA